MTLRGEAWSQSWQKRRGFDIPTALIMAPAAIALEEASPLLFGEESRDYPRLLASERVGASPDYTALTTFILYKCRTGPSELGAPYNSKLAQLVRKLGIDELSQWSNILDGTMTVRGHRPIPPEMLERAYDEASDGRLVDRHRRLVLPQKSGIISSFGIAAHLHTDGTRLELDIKDEIDGSFRYDMALIAEFAKQSMSLVIKQQ